MKITGTAEATKALCQHINFRLGFPRPASRMGSEGRPLNFCPACSTATDIVEVGGPDSRYLCPRCQQTADQYAAPVLGYCDVEPSGSVEGDETILFFLAEAKAETERTELQALSALCEVSA